MIARVRGRQEPLPALLHPLDGTAQTHREQAERDVLGIEDRLHPEPTAHVGRDDADAVLGQAEDPGQAVARQVRDLGAGPEGELALGRVPVRDPAAPFERRRRLPVRAEGALHHDGRAGQGRLHVAVLEPARQEHVVGRRVVDDGAVAAGSDDVHHRRQRLVVDRDQRGAVLGRVAVAGHDGGHRLAREARLRPGQDRLLGLDVGRQRRARAHAMPGEVRIGARHHRHDARSRRRARGLDAADPGVRVDAAHEGDVQHAGQLDVAHVPSPPGDEARVLLPGDTRPEHARRAGMRGAGHRRARAPHTMA